jgi:F-type H+-transporting ATPase subunit a
MFLFAESGGHHTPILVTFVNEYLGKPVHQFQVKYTKPAWDSFFAKFGTNAEAVFGEYTIDNAIPWYTIMFVVACLLTMALIWVFKGKLSDDDPKNGQLTLEATVVSLADLLKGVVGPHGIKYFPIVATFAVLIFISNVMGLFPLFMSPTASTSVTFALGICSFVYYNYIGIKENGVLSHLGHLAGPKLPGYMFLVTGLIFCIELISNLIRPMTLGMRLFGNMYADEQIAGAVSGIYPPFTQILLPAVFLFLALFVAFIQSFVFTLLSMIYLGEVSHAPHDHHDEHNEEARSEAVEAGEAAPAHA